MMEKQNKILVRIVVSIDDAEGLHFINEIMKKRQYSKVIWTKTLPQSYVFTRSRSPSYIAKWGSEVIIANEQTTNALIFNELNFLIANHFERSTNNAWNDAAVFKHCAITVG